MKTFLDSEAQIHLDNLIAFQTTNDYNQLLKQCQTVSQWIEHGRITPAMKAKLQEALPKAEEILFNKRK